MADQSAIRVLFRLHFGSPYQQAPEEERKKAGELVRETFKKWKASGIRLIGTFSSTAHVDGYAHYTILEVDDLSQVQEMDRDIFLAEVGKYIERFDFTVGISRQFIEDIWKSP